MTSYFIRKDILAREVIIEGTIVTTSPIKIGGGKSDISPHSIVKDAVLRDVEGNPVIPGSSWKGVFRSTGEKLASKRGLEVCSGVGRDNCLDKRRLSRQFQDLIKFERVDEAISIFWEKTCINCKTFGTQSVISAVKFTDSKPIKYSVGVRTMVAISRTEGAAARGALVTVETVEPGSQFTFKMIGTNLPNYIIGYLVAIMKEIHEGRVQIGGHKSRGFGFVKFDTLKLDVKDYKNEKKIGEEDKEVQVSYGREMSGDEFFKTYQPLIEVFNNVKLPYPKS